MSALPLDTIRTDGGTQPRATIDFNVVEEYAQAMADGAPLPPITVFHDGADYWLADGFHRRAAAEALGLVEIECDVRQGTRRDAVLHSVGANAAHGMRRTNDDKRRAVLTLLNDPEWSAWSDREIARRCAVEAKMVGRMRPKDTVPEAQYETRTFVHPKTGAPAQMKTSAIGRSPRQDRPVFDSTDTGERVSAERWTPDDIVEAEPAKPAPLVIPSEYHALRDMIRAFDKVEPRADAMAALVPIEVGHALQIEDIRRIASWWGAFLAAWEPGEQARQRYRERLRSISKEGIPNAAE